MSNRSLLILAVSFALPCNLSAQTPTIQVQVYDQAGLQPLTFQQFVARTQAIFVTAGLSVQVEACVAGAADPCASQTGSATRLQIRVLARSPKRSSNASHPPLGESFADRNGGSYASVFLERVTDEAAEANVPRVIVLAYATAHEIGHLPLGNDAHTPRGLMKAQWGRDEYQAMSQNHFQFSPEQLQALARRYGLSRPANPGPKPALAKTP